MKNFIFRLLLFIFIIFQAIPFVNGQVIGVNVGGKLEGPSLFGGPDHRYVFAFGYNQIFVVNTKGEIWARDLVNGGGEKVGSGYKLEGPSIFGGPDHRYVFAVDKRVMVVNSKGEVWARDIDINSKKVSSGYKLDGPNLFGADDHIFVFSVAGDLLKTNDNQMPRIAVINKKGEIWVRGINGNTIGSGYKLKGPSIFGGNDYEFVFGHNRKILVVNNKSEIWGRDADCSKLTIEKGQKYGMWKSGKPGYMFSNGIFLFYVNPSGELFSTSLIYPPVSPH